MATRLGGSNMTVAWRSLESKCRNCKKIFLHTAEHVYHGCCSYTCYRAVQRQEEAKERERQEQKLYLVSEQKLEKRIEQCKERIEYYKNLSWNKSAGQKTRDSARRAKNEWVRRQIEANDMLLNLRRWNNG